MQDHSPKKILANQVNSSFAKQQKSAASKHGSESEEEDGENNGIDFQNEAQTGLNDSVTRPTNVVQSPTTVISSKSPLFQDYEDDEHQPKKPSLPIKKQESGDESKRSFIFKRHVTAFIEDNPPLPLLPKSMAKRDDSPRTGGNCNFLKLTRFLGRDYGRSKFKEKAETVEKVAFPHNTTLKSVFQPIPVEIPKPPLALPNSTNNPTARKKKEQAPQLDQRTASAKKEKQVNKRDSKNLETAIQDEETKNIEEPAKNGNTQTISRNDKGTKNKEQNPGTNLVSPTAQKKESQYDASQPNPNMTREGELVYQRFPIDFKALTKQSKRDIVLEENLLDVKKLLKSSNMAQATQSKENEADPEKKQLVKVNLEPFYKSKGPTDTTLVFESRFESGNLAAVTKVGENDYHMLLQNDVNTGGHTQWFFFRVNNVVMGEVRFNMLNLCKPDSLYNEGMKILVYSERKAAHRDVGWHRSGTKISYYCNGIKKESEKKNQGGPFKSYYTHTFTYEFEYDDDTVYFAYCYPYTYSNLQDDLSKIMQDPVKSQFTQRQKLCETLAGNKLDMLTITSNQNKENMAKRKGVVITARVHPGESVGSWMMRGALNFLCDTTSHEAELLRQNFVFKVIPMLNPDGVINGNYRCSLAGCDLNRRWKAPSKVLHPTIYHTKQMIHNFAKERELSIFCDFHGHSRRKNIFMYGCNIPSSPEDTRIFPFILSNLCPFFIYNHSRFGNQKSKESTARMALFNELKSHPAIYTVEASFCGNDVGQWAKYHFSTEMLQQLGIDFCRSLLIYNTIPSPPTILEGFIRNIDGIYSHYRTINEHLQPIEKDPDVELFSLYKNKMEQMEQQGIAISTQGIKKALLKVLRQHSDVVSDGETTSSAGSDNAPSEDNLQPEEIAEIIPIEADPNLAKKVKKKQGENVDGQPPKIPSPLKKKQTTVGPGNQSGKRISLLATRKINNNKKRDDLSGRRSGAGSASQRSRSNAGESKDEKQDNPGEENVVHKKKLKKNVVSKDAWTQTDRSDYMLIKQRQKQKEIMQLAKQGMLPPGVNPQALVQQFIQMQPGNQQMMQQPQPQTQPQTQVKNGDNKSYRQQIIVNNSQNPAAALAYQQQMNQQYIMSLQQNQINYNQQVMKNPALAQQQLRQQQQIQQQNTQGSVQISVNSQGEQVLTLTDANGKRLIGTPDMLYNQATGKFENTLQMPAQQQQQFGNTMSQPMNQNNTMAQPATQQPQTQQNWFNHPNRNLHSSYSPQKGRKVISRESQQQVNTTQPSSSQMVDANRNIASQNGPRGSSQAGSTSQPADQPKQSWEQAISQSKGSNNAINQWIINKSRENGGAPVGGMQMPHTHPHAQIAIQSRGKGSAHPNIHTSNQSNASQGSYLRVSELNSSQQNMRQGSTPGVGYSQNLNNSRTMNATQQKIEAGFAGLHPSEALPHINLQTTSPNPRTKKTKGSSYKGPLNRSGLNAGLEKIPNSGNQNYIGGVQKIQNYQKTHSNAPTAISVDGIHQNAKTQHGSLYGFNQQKREAGEPARQVNQTKASMQRNRKWAQSKHFET